MHWADVSQLHNDGDADDDGDGDDADDNDANDEEADDDDVNRDDNGDDHLYKISDPIGLQSLSAEPCSARNGVLQSASFGAECGKWC